MIKWLWRRVTLRKINKIIIHCSATPPSMDIGVIEIDRWHRDRGFNSIGYHYVITRSGVIEDGRPLDKIGAHVSGHNKDSIGICLVGGVEEGNVSHAQDNFTDKQWDSLRRLLMMLTVDYKRATIHGHNEYAAKSCPSFDVQYELSEGRLKDV